MRGRKTRYTFVIQFLGGTYVYQASGESPELALRQFLRFASEEDDWTAYRVQLLGALADEKATPVDGCDNVWCISGFAGEYLFLIHIVATQSGPGGVVKTLEAQMEGVGADPKQWGWGDRW